MRATFIAWTRYQRRTELLAQHLGATLHFICYGQQGRLVQAPIRYLVQARQTWSILRRERPDVIFTQNPPIFGPLIAYVYAQRYDTHFVIDSHTGAFLSPKWRWSLILHRLLSKEALVTIVHNKHQAEIVDKWGCRYFVLIDSVSEYPHGIPFPFEGEFNVVVISSYSADEPLDVVFKAASKLQKTCFYITGESERLESRWMAMKPANCYLTGYLPDEQYIGLLRGADAVMVLTTRNHTLLSGAFEAVSIGTPLIVSDWPIMRDYFSAGTIHVSNTVEGVYEGVQRTQCEQVELQQGILHLRQQLCNQWEQGFQELRGILLDHQEIDDSAR